MSSTPIVYRKQHCLRRQVAAGYSQKSLSRYNAKSLSNGDSQSRKKTFASDSDSDSASGYSTPVGVSTECLSSSFVSSKLRVLFSENSGVSNVSEKGNSICVKENRPKNGADLSVSDVVGVPCDVTCNAKNLSAAGGRCDCSLRWKKTSEQAVNQALASSSPKPLSGRERRLAYERSERAAGRDPDGKICARLERNEPLYPNCDMPIWLRTCDVEAVVPVSGQVHGVIPAWIRGTLLRNGPGKMYFGDEEFAHLFDGSALIHRFAIANGTATYQSRFLRTKTFLENSAAQRIVVSEYGTRGCPDPCKSIFNRVAAMFTPGEASSDNAMITVYPFGDEFYAFTESTVVTRFDPVTLHTIDRVNLANYVGIINHSAHPAIFPDYAVSLGMALSKTGPRYTLVHFPIKDNMSSNFSQDSSREAPDENINSKEDLNRSRAFTSGRIVAGVPARWPLHPAYMHTFGITDNYFVLVEQPMSVSIAKVVYSQLADDSTSTAMQWFTDQPTFIHLIERAGGRHSHSFSTATLFFLHVINAFDENNFVVIDICCYENPDMINCMYVDALRTGQQNPDYARMFRGRPLRFRLPLKGPMAEAAEIAVSQPVNNRTSETICLDPTFVRPTQLSDLGCETPRVPQHLVGKPYRYFYAISSDVNLDNPGTLIKVDTIRKKSWRWAQPGVYPSEPVFVPRPSGRTEDDGVILSALTWSSDERKSALLILDGPSWTEVGRVEFQTPGSVPKCLHGWFAPNVL